MSCFGLAFFFRLVLFEMLASLVSALRHFKILVDRFWLLKLFFLGGVGGVPLLRVIFA